MCPEEELTRGDRHLRFVMSNARTLDTQSLLETHPWVCMSDVRMFLLGWSYGCRWFSGRPDFCNEKGTPIDKLPHETFDLTEYHKSGNRMPPL
jgi:hypothetical protein